MTADILRVRIFGDPAPAALRNITSTAGRIATAIRNAASEKMAGRFSRFLAVTPRQYSCPSAPSDLSTTRIESSILPGTTGYLLFISSSKTIIPSGDSTDMNF